jgi:hypothetical protein
MTVPHQLEKTLNKYLKKKFFFREVKLSADNRDGNK